MQGTLHLDRIPSITNAKLAGSIANDKLANSTVNFGGVSLALGGSDTTPAFDLQDSTNTNLDNIKDGTGGKTPQKDFGFEDNKTYYRVYGQKGFDDLHKTARSDLIRHQTPSNVEYWDFDAGTPGWTADPSSWAGESPSPENESYPYDITNGPYAYPITAGIKKMLDGNVETEFFVPLKFRKIRFEVTRNKRWANHQAFTMITGWSTLTFSHGGFNGVGETAVKMNPTFVHLEQYHGTNGDWTTHKDFKTGHSVPEQRLDWSENYESGLIDNYGVYMYYRQTGMHMNDDVIRVTLEWPAWDNSNAIGSNLHPFYVRVRHLHLFSWWSGEQNVPYPIKSNFDKEIIIGYGSTGVVKSNGSQDMQIKTGSGGSNIVVKTGTNGDVNISPGGTGETNVASSLELTGASDVLKINGSSVLTKTELGSTVTSSALTSVGTLSSLALGGALTTTSTIDGVDIAARDGVLTSTTTTANNALPKAGGTMTGALTIATTTDAMINLKATDDAWAYMQFLQNDGTRKAWMGLNSDQSEFKITVENSATKIDLVGDVDTLALTSTTGTFTGDTVKIGTGGTGLTLKNNSGALQLRNEADDADITLADGYIASASTWNAKLDKTGTIANNDVAKFDSNGDLVGRSYSEMKSDLDLEIGTDIQAYSAKLTTIAGLSDADGKVLVGSGSGWVVEDGATLRTSIGVDAAGTDNSTDVTFAAGSKDYLSLSGQEITVGAVDLSDNVTGLLPKAGVNTSGTWAVDDIPTLSAAKISDVAPFAQDGTYASLTAGNATLAAKASALNTTSNGVVKTSSSNGTLSVGDISASDITDVDAFSQSGTYASLRAQATTKGDVGLSNVTNHTQVTKATFNEHTILVANSDNTPSALAIGASEIVGRKASGNIASMTKAETQTVLNVADGATANDTDANLKNRANHTGTQAASTISDFDTEVANNSAVTANTAKTSFPGFGSDGSTAAVGNDSRLSDARQCDNTFVNAATAKTNLSLSASDVGLGNVTNESKSTMFTDPTITGTTGLQHAGTLPLESGNNTINLGGGLGAGNDLRLELLGNLDAHSIIAFNVGNQARFLITHDEDNAGVLNFYGDTTGDNIASTSDTVAMTINQNGNVTATGSLNSSGLNAGSGNITTTGTVSFGTLTDTGESIAIAKFVDEADGIGSNDNDNTIPTSAAVKDYVDSKVKPFDWSISTGGYFTANDTTPRTQSWQADDSWGNTVTFSFIGGVGQVVSYSDVYGGVWVAPADGRVSKCNMIVRNLSYADDLTIKLWKVNASNNAVTLLFDHDISVPNTSSIVAVNEDITSGGTISEGNVLLATMQKQATSGSSRHYFTWTISGTFD